MAMIGFARPSDGTYSPASTAERSMMGKRLTILVSVDYRWLDAPSSGETVAPMDVGRNGRGRRHLDAADGLKPSGPTMGQSAVAAYGVLGVLAESARRARLEHQAWGMRARPAGARQGPLSTRTTPISGSRCELQLTASRRSRLRVRRPLSWRRWPSCQVPVDGVAEAPHIANSYKRPIRVTRVFVTVALNCRDMVWAHWPFEPDIPICPKTGNEICLALIMLTSRRNCRPCRQRHGNGRRRSFPFAKVPDNRWQDRSSGGKFPGTR